MSKESPAQRGMYFEEFKPGLRIISAGRTVTESDIVFFAGLSGDFNQIHIDAEYSKASPFGARVAPGLLVQTGFMEGTVMAFREVNEWKFIKPIYIGDTIHVEAEVKETKAIPRIGGGSINIVLDVKNQQGETVMKGSWKALIAARPK